MDWLYESQGPALLHNEVAMFSSQALSLGDLPTSRQAAQHSALSLANHVLTMCNQLAAPRDSTARKHPHIRHMKLCLNAVADTGLACVQSYDA